jgi:hypothetical protein
LKKNRQERKKMEEKNGKETKREQINNKTEKLYSFEYTKISKAFFTPHHRR